MILVIGSSNTDMVIKSERIPSPGETIIGGKFFMNPGGKGANQAVAAARAGGKVTFICKVGADLFGDQAITQFKNEGIDTSFILKDASNPSGVALITVDRHGENSIVVAPGSNGNLTVKDLQQAEKIMQKASIVLMQLETPIETIEYAAAKAFGQAKVILNPAPAQALPASLLSKIYLLTPNEHEAEMLSGVKVHDVASADVAAQKLQALGVRNVMVTLGSQGVLVREGIVSTHIPTRKVEAVDTTAAGDIFNGAVAVALSEGKSMADAARFGCAAAAISVTRMGAQSSAPYRNEIV